MMPTATFLSVFIVLAKWTVFANLTVTSRITADESERSVRLLNFRKG